MDTRQSKTSEVGWGRGRKNESLNPGLKLHDLPVIYYVRVSALFFNTLPCGAADGPAYSSQWTHLAWSLLLFPHSKGVEWRCRNITSFSGSAFIKEKFAFVSVKMMGVLFAPVDMGIWSPNSCFTQKLLSLAFYNLKLNSIYVLNGSVLVRIRDSMCLFPPPLWLMWYNDMQTGICQYFQ